MTIPIVIEAWPESRPPADLFFQLPPQPGRFLLESQGGPVDICRWSFLGHRPFMRLRSFGRHIQLWERGSQKEWDDDPLAAIQSQLDRYPLTAPRPPAPYSPAPWPFIGGAVGYLSYDLGRQIEHLPDTAQDDLHLPELCFDFYDHLIAIDHATQIASLIALPLLGHEETAYAAAAELRELVHKTQSIPTSPDQPNHPSVNLTSNFTRPAYHQAIERTLDYIARGHIYQANIAQRFSVALGEPVEPGELESLYRALRANNPAPFAAFLDYGEFQVISASPERFLRFDPTTRRVETRPIKGTRPRGKTSEDDDRLKAELLASEKDKAELVMIVDLERNDLGRVCEYGSVRVTDLRRIEAYPTVWHTVATVEGQLRAGAIQSDLIRATFPGGSITGAPKIRAMQIIEELEVLRRHVYCGAIGYFGFNGGLDLNIAIRTITVKNGQAYFHAGGGIVADSDPASEYDETFHKARALARALGVELDREINY